jgi:hypothetical protein
MNDSSPPKLWFGPASKRDHCTAALLGAGRLQVAEIPDEQRDSVEKHLGTFAAKGDALAKETSLVLLSAVRAIELNPATAELSIDYQKEPGQDTTNLAVPFADSAAVQEAFDALRDRLGAGWQAESARQSAWKAAGRPCQFLLLAVGLPAIAVLVGALGGDVNTDINSKEDFLGCLYCIAVIVGVTLGIIYLGVLWTLAIGAGLVGVWLLWLWAEIARRPELSRLVRG